MECASIWQEATAVTFEHIVGPSPRPRPSVAHTAASRAVERDEEIRAMSDQDLLDGIERLRVERHALVLAHNYQIPEIQDLADFAGDSLQLAQQAEASDAPLIVFCGVHFMAETAAILCPGRRVVIPDAAAGCSLAATVTVDDLRAWKAEHPDAVVVAYVNTAATVKAEADYCCTSANAVQVVRSIPEDRAILFLPDMFLGMYVERMTGRDLHLWLGECHVHAGIRADDVAAMLGAHPGADLLLHPECGCVSQCLWAMARGDLPADRVHVLGTGGMVRHAAGCTAPVDLVGTEVGLLHRLRVENPTKRFLPLRQDSICDYMKTITLPKLYRSLRDLVEEVTVPEPTARRARRAIERMFAATA
jgi:quinolinate synthase